VKRVFLCLLLFPVLCAAQQNPPAATPTPTATPVPDCADALIASVEPDFAVVGNSTSYTIVGRFPKGCNVVFGGQPVLQGSIILDGSNKIIFTAVPAEGPNQVQIGDSTSHVVMGEQASVLASSCPRLPTALIQHRARRVLEQRNYCQIGPAGEKALVIDAADTLRHKYYDKTPADLSCEKVQYSPGNGALQIRTDDTLRVFVCNKNPFTTNYKLTVSGNLIPEDDLSAFLGALVPGLGASAAADTATKSAQSPQSKALFANNVVSVPDCTVPIRDRIIQLENDYVAFFTYYNEVRSELVTEQKCEALARGGQLLYSYANDEVESLADTGLENFITNYLAQLDASNTASPDDKSTQTLRSSILQYQCIAKQFHSVGDDILSGVVTPLEVVLGAGADAFRSRAAVINENQDGPQQVTWKLVTDVVKPLPQLKAGEVATQIQSCLTPAKQNDTTKPVEPAAGGSGSPATAAPPNSPANGQRHNETNASHNVGSSLESQSTAYRINPVRMQSISLNNLGTGGIRFLLPIASGLPVGGSNGGGQDTSKSSTPSKSQKAPAGGSPADGTNASDQTPKASEEVKAAGKINFGKARFIASAGVAYVHLGNVQFQKGVGQALDANGAPIAGKNAASIVTFQANSGFRVSPLLLAHARLPVSYRDTSVFVTVGVTAKKDNQSTSAEYLLGLSVPMLQDHLFGTLGAYVGQKQKLSGMFVGQEIPSSLTGDIPVQKDYAVGFSAALSFRIPKLAK
jgi:hypothetical protein